VRSIALVMIYCNVAVVTTLVAVCIIYFMIVRYSFSVNVIKRSDLKFSDSDNVIVK